MSGTFFPLTALSNFEGLPFELSNASTRTGYGQKPETAGVMDERSFFDVFQRQTSSLPASVFFTDQRPADQTQRLLEMKKLFLVPESVGVLEKRKPEKAVPLTVGTLTPLDFRSFQPVEENKGTIDFEGRKFWKDLVPPFVNRELQDHGDEREFTNQPAVPVSFLSLPSLVPDPRSYPEEAENNSTRMVPNLEHTLPAVAKPSVAHSPESGQEIHSPTLPNRDNLPGKAQDSLVIDKRTEPAISSPRVAESFSEASRDNQGRLPKFDSIVTPPVQENGLPIFRRPIMIHDERALHAPSNNPVFSSRPMLTSDAQTPLQPNETSGLPEPRLVPGGYGHRGEGGGGVVGGTAIPQSEGLSDMSGSKMDPIRVQGDMERQGMDHNGKSESGPQGGLGGFSQFPSGQQQSSPQSGQMARGVQAQDEAATDRPAQPLQRLQLDVQISETQRVQIDVGVQHRQVYAGLVMDQMALRNLAVQFVPQLDEQLSQLNLELNQFSAEMSEEQGSEGDSASPHNRPESDGFKETVGSPPVRTPSLSRPLTGMETGLHFVA